MIQTDFKDFEQWKSLERQAYEGTINFDKFPANEYKYFRELLKLYTEYRFGSIDKGYAQQQKALLLKEYTQSVQERERYLYVYRTYQENVVTLQHRLAEIEKAQTAEEIADLACSCLELLTGEFEFAKRQRRKIFKGGTNMIVNGKWLTAYDMADLIHEQEQKIDKLKEMLRQAESIISRTAHGDCKSCKKRFGCTHPVSCEYIWEHSDRARRMTISEGGEGK